MSKFTTIYREAAYYVQQNDSLIELLKIHGNKLFDSQHSDISDIIGSARFFRDCTLPGPIYEIGAGEGTVALLLACLIERPIVAFELVEVRAARIAERAARFGLKHLSVCHGDVFARDLSATAGCYVFTPFFDADSVRFADKVARECRAGTRIFGKGMVVNALRACPRMREMGKRRSFGRAEMVLA